MLASDGMWSPDKQHDVMSCATAMSLISLRRRRPGETISILERCCSDASQLAACARAIAHVLLGGDTRHQTVFEG